MTKESFEKIISDQNQISNKANWILGIIFIIVGLFFTVRILLDGIEASSKSQLEIVGVTIGIVFLPIFSLALGIYVFIKIPKQYLVKEYLSQLSTDSKKVQFLQTLSNYKIITFEELGDYYKITGRKNRNGFIIYLYVDDEKYLFNVQSQDVGYIKGIIDFGVSNRITKEITACL